MYKELQTHDPGMRQIAASSKDTLIRLIFLSFVAADDAF